MAKENQNTEMARLLEQNAILIEQNAKMTKDFERMRAMMTEMLNALRASRPTSISTAVFTPGQSPSVVIEDSSHPPGFPYPIGHNVVEAFAVRPEVPPQPQGLYVRPPVNIPAYTVPAAVAVYPSNNDLQVQARDPHYDHPQGNNFRHAESFDQGHHPESHTDVDRLGKIDEGELARKMESPEQTIRSIQSYGGSISFDELCLFSDMTLLEGFSVPKFELYNGQGDPTIHMKSYCNRMRGVKKQELLIACFGDSLSGAASEWWSHQDHTKWQTFEDLAQAFWNHFKYNMQIAPTVASLENIKKKPNESFSEFAFRWREQAARVQPPLADEKEMIRYFMKSVDEIYYQVLIAATGKSFNLAIDMGEMVEQGIKDGKIINLAALRLHQIEGCSSRLD